MIVRKDELRRRLLKERKQMEPDSVKSLSRRITDHFCGTDFYKNSKIFHIYYPINNEVDTRQLMERLWSLGKKVIMPRTCFEKGTLVNYTVTSFNDLEHTRFSMLEPDQNKCPVFHEEPHVVVVPGVAFSRNKERLGYGGGFYDRFLSCSGAWKIAFAYNLQLTDSIPREKHDIMMDAVITEQGIIY